MNEVRALAEHGPWARERIAQAQAEAADPATQWADHSEVEADSAAQRARIETDLKNRD